MQTSRTGPHSVDPVAPACRVWRTSAKKLFSVWCLRIRTPGNLVGVIGSCSGIRLLSDNNIASSY